MIALILFLNSFFPYDCREQYLNAALQSNGSNGYYIVVDVEVKKKSGQVVVLNRNLYELLRRKQKNKLDFETYKKPMKDKIVNGEDLRLSTRDLATMETQFIPSDTLAENWAKKGKEAFFNRFFVVSYRLNYARLKDDVPASSFSSIIRILFDWNYLTSNVEGRLAVENLTFCDHSK